MNMRAAFSGASVLRTMAAYWPCTASQQARLGDNIVDLTKHGQRTRGIESGQQQVVLIWEVADSRAKLREHASARQWKGKKTSGKSHLRRRKTWEQSGGEADAERGGAASGYHSPTVISECKKTHTPSAPKCLKHASTQAH